VLSARECNRANLRRSCRSMYLPTISGLAISSAQGLGISSMLRYAEIQSESEFLLRYAMQWSLLNEQLRKSAQQVSSSRVLLCQLIGRTRRRSGVVCESIKTVFGFSLPPSYLANFLTNPYLISDDLALIALAIISTIIKPRVESLRLHRGKKWLACGFVRREATTGRSHGARCH